VVVPSRKGGKRFDFGRYGLRLLNQVFQCLDCLHNPLAKSLEANEIAAYIEWARHRQYEGFEGCYSEPPDQLELLKIE
jgi:hypothetical protein